MFRLLNLFLLCTTFTMSENIVKRYHEFVLCLEPASSHSTSMMSRLEFYLLHAAVVSVVVLEVGLRSGDQFLRILSLDSMEVF